MGKPARGSDASSFPSELSKFKAAGRRPAASETRRPLLTTAKGSTGTHAERAARPASGNHRTEGGHLPASPWLHGRGCRGNQKVEVCAKGKLSARKRSKNIKSFFAGPKPRDRNSSRLKQDHKSRRGRRLWLSSLPQPQTKSAALLTRGGERTQPPAHPAASRQAYVA